MLDSFKRTLELLQRGEKRYFYALIALVLVMGVVDVVSVASILPFLAVVANPAEIQQNPVLRYLYVELGFTGTNPFLLFLGFGVFMIVVLGIAFRALTFYALVRFTRQVGLSLATRLLAKYLAQSYDWFLNRHSAQLGRKVLAEVIEVVNGSIMALMRLIANVVIIVALLALLVALKPGAALMAVALVGGCYGLVFMLIRPYLDTLGEARLQANRERFQVMQEALGGIKEVKVLSLEKSYLKRFRAPALRLVDYQAKMAMIGDLPRHVLEAVVFGGMLLFVITLLISGDGNLAEVVPILGVYAFAGARLFPTIQQVYTNFTTMKFSKPALDSLHKDLTERWAGEMRLDSNQPPVPLDRLLELDNVVFAYPEADRAALNGLSLSIPARTTVGFVGATGAGKSTAVDVILGLLQPQQGELRVDGVPIHLGNVKGWQKSVGYVPQSIFLVDDTIAANIAFGVERHRIDMAAVREAARIAQLEHVIDPLPEGYDTLIGERGIRLSGGQRQRIGIARALYRRPDILIFDEATSALDNLTERAFMDAIRALGHEKTIIMIAHRLSTVRHCDRIFLLEDGRLAAAGSYDELVEQSDDFRALHEATT